MRQNEVSQTALKVALNLITLNVKEAWSARLPKDLAELSEKLILAAEVPLYGPRTMAMSKRPWMVRVYEFADFVIPGHPGSRS